MTLMENKKQSNHPTNQQFIMRWIYITQAMLNVWTRWSFETVIRWKRATQTNVHNLASLAA